MAPECTAQNVGRGECVVECRVIYAVVAVVIGTESAANLTLESVELIAVYAIACHYGTVQCRKSLSTFNGCRGCIVVEVAGAGEIILPFIAAIVGRFLVAKVGNILGILPFVEEIEAHFAAWRAVVGFAFLLRHNLHLRNEVLEWAHFDEAVPFGCQSLLCGGLACVALPIVVETHLGREVTVESKGEDAVAAVV